MKRILTLICLTLQFVLLAQVPTPTLYFTITSHNEMTTTEAYDTAPTYTFYHQTKDTLRKIIDLIYSKNAKYDLQTCQKFVLGCLHAESAATSTTDILEYAYKLGGMPYGNVVQIDPRYKTQTPTYTYNIADVAHLIDSTGASASKVIGGFVYYNSTVTAGTNYTYGDWTTYLNTINGTFSNNWKADILWGAGSIPPHTHDASNYGVWKPRDKTDSISFFCHDPAQTVWIQGNGCSWNLDPTANIQTIISEIRSEATKIKNGTYPANKFYNATLMINFKDFQSVGLRARLAEVIDSINVMKNQGKIIWATINQKQTAFQSWSTANAIAYSQWRCGQTNTLTPTCTLNNLNEQQKIIKDYIKLMPNPANNKLIISWEGDMSGNSIIKITDQLGRLVYETKMEYSITEVDLQNLSQGFYNVMVENNEGKLTPKKLLIQRD